MQECNEKSPYLLLWEISRGSRLLYVVALLFMFASIYCSFMLPQVVRFVVDSVIADEAVTDIPLIPLLVAKLGGVYTLRENMSLAGILVLLIAATGGGCTFVYRQTLAMGAEGIAKRLRDRVYAHIQYLPYEWHVGVQTGDIVQRCTSDVDTVWSFVSSQLSEVVRALVLVAFAYFILFPMNARMALASFAFLPVIFCYSFVFLRRVSDRFLAADEAEGELLSIAQENFTGVRVVRAFGRERYEVDRFDRQNRHFSELWIRLGDLLSTYWGLGDLLTGLQMVTICAVGTFQAAQGEISVGGFIVFLAYNSMTIWPVRALGRVLSEASKAGVSLGRLREILDAPMETDAPDALRASLTGDIAFENVMFSYGGHTVLRNISFTAEAGKTLGILGATGSGKTTLAHLICRLYDLAEGCGSIRIGGTDIRCYERDWLRGNIGIVLQEPFLYSRTIGENIASLARECTAEEIRAAAEVSQVDAAIEQFAEGYDTIVGERGVTLSGGQKQRVAIARAILKNPPILIFDDSLSAVDTETDARIRAALSERRKGATTLIISHRITSISGADKILVLEDGEIVEMGSPADLMTRGGIYRRISDLQRSVEDELTEVSG